MVAESLIHSSGISIIQDTFQTNCSVLINHYLQSWCNSKQPFIIVFTFATPVDRLYKYLSTGKRVVIIDCFSDCDGWDNLSNEIEIIEKSSNYKIIRCINPYCISTLYSLFEKAQQIMNYEKQVKKVSILIDSLGVLLLEHSYGNVHNFLFKLYKQCEPKQSRIVGILHTDTLNDQDISQLEYGVHTVVHVKTPVAMLEALPGEKDRVLLSQISTLKSQRMLIVRHDRPSGRVAWATEGYGVNMDGNLVSMKVPKKAPINIDVSTNQNTLDPTANLTFNLKLTEEEQNAKEKLILPYMHHLDESTANDPSKPGSIIYYDSDDDYDEEDPDDDLDI